MIDVDELLRAHWPTPPPPDAAAPAEVASRALRAARSRRFRRAPASLPRIGLVVAATALLAVLAIVFVRLEKSPGPEAAGPADGWGLVATVNVAAKYPGDDLGDVTNRAVRLLERRWALGGMTGIAVRSKSPGTIELRVPNALRDDQVMGLITSADYRIYDTTTAVYTSTDPRAVAGWLASHADATAAPSWFVALPTDARTAPFSRTQPDRAALEADLAMVPKDRYAVAAVPPGLWLLSPQHAGEPYFVVPIRPVVAAEDITGATATAEPFAPSDLQVTNDARSRVEAALSQRGQKSSSLVFAAVSESTLAIAHVDSVSQGDNARVHIVPDAYTGRFKTGGFVLPGAYPRDIAAGGVSAWMRLVTATPYGEAPTPSGEPVSDIPEPVRKALKDPNSIVNTGPNAEPGVPQPTTVRHILDASEGGETWNLLAARTATRRDVYWAIRPGASSPATQPGGVITGDCDPGLGDQRLTYCVNIQDVPAKEFLHIGRVGPGVTAVDGVTRSGERKAGSVANGWFMLPEDGESAQPLRFEAIDRATGAVLATVTPR